MKIKEIIQQIISKNSDGIGFYNYFEARNLYFSKQEISGIDLSIAKWVWIVKSKAYERDAYSKQILNRRCGLCFEYENSNEVLICELCSLSKISGFNCKDIENIAPKEVLRELCKIKKEQSKI